jgi:5-hydroxyisourate hydrolase
MTVSSHVLDAVTGRPAAGLPVALRRRSDQAVIAEALTGADGRIPALAGELAAGDYQLSFDVESYSAASFYPEVVITFRIIEPAAHYHVPLLLSPFAYSTYRGS